jgi:hypothetical protein
VPAKVYVKSNLSLVLGKSGRGCILRLEVVTCNLNALFFSVIIRVLTEFKA